MTRLLFMLLFASAVVFSAAEVQTAQASDLTVHEWGTFTSVAGPDGSAIEWDALGGKDDLPHFVNEFAFRCSKVSIRGTARMETPVMYFYSSEAMQANVKVAFPRGLITEWYPKAVYQVFQRSGVDGATHRLQANLNGIDTSLRSLTGAIEWANIQVEPNTSPALPTENTQSRYYAARATDSAPLTVGDQHEKFLFYRGVGRFPIPLAAQIESDGSIVVQRRGAETVPAVILFENRAGQMGYRNAGVVKDAVNLESPVLDSSVPVLRTELEAVLVAQGLFPKEAEAMVETWKDSWFEEGMRLIYIVPSRAVDAFLPLHVDPAPSETARVFVGRIELITPEITRTVREAMAKGDWSAMEPYGRFLGSILDRIVSDNPYMENAAEQVRAKLFTGACR